MEINHGDLWVGWFAVQEETIFLHSGKAHYPDLGIFGFSIPDPGRMKLSSQSI